jgi:hypothetical protein
MRVVTAVSLASDVSPRARAVRTAAACRSVYGRICTKARLERAHRGSLPQIVNRRDDSEVGHHKLQNCGIAELQEGSVECISALQSCHPAILQYYVIAPMQPDPPRHRPLERFWPYADLPEQPSEEELAQLDPDLYEALFGATPRPFSITVVFPAIDDPRFDEALALARRRRVSRDRLLARRRYRALGRATRCGCASLRHRRPLRHHRGLTDDVPFRTRVVAAARPFLIPRDSAAPTSKAAAPRGRAEAARRA